MDFRKAHSHNTFAASKENDAHRSSTYFDCDIKKRIFKHKKLELWKIWEFLNAAAVCRGAWY